MLWQVSHKVIKLSGSCRRFFVIQDDEHLKPCLLIYLCNICIYGYLYYVFLGACTNGRIEDFRAFASIVKGRKKADNVVAWLVPGSWAVRQQIENEGLDRVLADAGFEIRQPGCSACLAMNDDKVPAGKYAVSTSNRNFEGRQGPGSRTILASPLVAAAAAVTGVITDPRTLL